ncbi:MAG: hypothetical protein QOE47_1151 [Pyrinomonadaceae bacterium]|jgi:hypothetical protein|nr:hypothetical protein [Pyrinomonadaceae bacterium]
MNFHDDEAKINEAVERCLRSYLSPDVEQRITDLFGAHIAARTRAVYDDAMRCPVDWRTAKMDDALAVLHDFLDEKYPWLTAEARSRLNYCFIMSWK